MNAEDDGLESSQNVELRGDEHSAEALDATFESLLAVRIYKAAEELAQLARITFEKEYGLRFTDVRILTQLKIEGGISVGEISRRANIDKAWISRLVRELEDKNIVQREPDRDDNRAMLVSLTDEGRILRGEIMRFLIKREEDLSAGIDEEAFCELLETFIANTLRVRIASGGD